MANLRPMPHPSLDRADNDLAPPGQPADAGAAATLDLPNLGLPNLDPTNFSQVVDNLRARATGVLKDVQRDVDTLLSGVTLAAFELTGASGAALALRTRGSVICRASAGATAPPVGAQLDANSGISGECFRTGVAQLCSDVATDPRVDAEASRQLGVHSLIAVPLCDQAAVLGILEIFADRPHAFTDAHTALLEQLAEIAVFGRLPELESDFPRIEESRFETTSADQTTRANDTALANDTRPTNQDDLSEPAASTILAIPGDPVLAESLSAVRDRRITRAALALALVACVIAAGWLLWREVLFARLRSANGKAAASVQTSPASAYDGNNSGSTSTSIDGLAPARQKPGASNPSSADDLVMRASSTAPLYRSGPLQVIPGGRLPAHGVPNSADEPAAPAISELLANSPSASAPVPSAIVMTSIPLPVEKVEVSQGLTGGTLVHRVTPTYPKLAAAQNLEGAVVLQGVVGEDGNLHDLKMVAGDPILAQAAERAVAQWRYAPYQLNGKPVSMRTQITVQFKLSQ